MHILWLTKKSLFINFETRQSYHYCILILLKKSGYIKEYCDSLTLNLNILHRPVMYPFNLDFKNHINLKMCKRLHNLPKWKQHMCLYLVTWVCVVLRIRRWLFLLCPNLPSPSKLASSWHCTIRTSMLGVTQTGIWCLWKHNCYKERLHTNPYQSFATESKWMNLSFFFFFGSANKCFRKYRMGKVL